MEEEEEELLRGRRIGEVVVWGLVAGGRSGGFRLWRGEARRDGVRDLFVSDRDGKSPAEDCAWMDGGVGRP